MEPIGPTNDHEVFDFFALPRELRDMVLKNTLDVIKDEGRQGHLRFQIQNLAPLRLLLVSRQFKQELEESVMAFMHVHVTDAGEINRSAWRPSDRLYQGVSMTMELGVNCSKYAHKNEACQIKAELGVHSLRLAAVLRDFKHLQDISINLYMMPHQYTKECEDEMIKHLPRLLASVQMRCNVKRLSLLQMDFWQDETTEWSFSGVSTLTMTYCSETKQLQRVVPPEIRSQGK